MEKIIFKNIKDLLKLNNLLPDAFIELNSAKFNKNLGEFVIKFVHQALDGSNFITRKKLFWKIYKITIPNIEYEIKLSSIENININDKSNIGKYSFEKCLINDQTVKLIFVEDLTIVLEIGKEFYGKLSPVSQKKGNISYFKYIK